MCLPREHGYSTHDEKIFGVAPLSTVLNRIALNILYTIASSTPVKIGMYINSAAVDTTKGTLDTRMYLKLDWVDARLAGIAQGERLQDRVHLGPDFITVRILLPHLLKFRTKAQNAIFILSSNSSNGPLTHQVKLKIQKSINCLHFQFQLCHHRVF